MSLGHDLSYPGAPGHQCYTYEERSKKVNQNRSLSQRLALLDRLATDPHDYVEQRPNDKACDLCGNPRVHKLHPGTVMPGPVVPSGAKLYRGVAGAARGRLVRAIQQTTETWWCEDVASGDTCIWPAGRFAHEWELIDGPADMPRPVFPSGARVYVSGDTWTLPALRDPADDRPVDPVAGEGTDAERGTWDEVDTKQRLRNIVDLCEWAAHDDDQGAVKTRAILDLARGVPLDRSGMS